MSSYVPQTESALQSRTDGTALPSVYYDGGCPLCRAEIASYQRTRGGDALRWVDASACDASALGPGLERAAALAHMHVRRADGTLLRGAAAFAEIWNTLPGWRWLARLTRIPGVLPVMDAGYAVFLRVRPLWRRPQGRGVEQGACGLGCTPGGAAGPCAEIAHDTAKRHPSA